ncbi:acyltransferase [Vibrio cholerae]|uniref:acyltransferase n=1 Tax=Vibrio cholerae TaxID=666 RepID=UPI0011D7BCAA|nr:acyltransferase [Vibrio cholerae]TXY73113.1 acyltransferase [Vibrio cholerae]BCN21968.1 putative acetyltransferase [Vibrio cholerae]GIB45616.1 Maltose O-acetyltransferase [Vibrio cholerae]
MFIRKVIRRFFYNPYKFVAKHPFIKCASSTILQREFTVDFRENIKKSRVEIGENNILACALIFESDAGFIKIGNNTFINGSTKIISRSSVEIGNYVTIAWNVTIYDHDSHSLNHFERRKDIEQQLLQIRAGKNFIKNKDWSTVSSKPIKICDDAWIGMNAIILKGVTIGKGAVVAANSVVTKNVPDFTVVAGNPAQIVKRIEY